MVKNTSEGLKVLRASMMTWPEPVADAGRLRDQHHHPGAEQVEPQHHQQAGQDRRDDHARIDLPFRRAHGARHVDRLRLTPSIWLMVASTMWKNSAITTMKIAGALPMPNRKIATGSQAIGETGESSVMVGSVSFSNSDEIADQHADA